MTTVTVSDLLMAKEKKKKKPVARKNRRRTKAASPGVRKVTRRKRKTSHPTFNKDTILDIDQVYRAINKVQLTRQNVEFVVKDADSAVIDNILRDLSLPFEKKPLKVDTIVATIYVVSPGAEKGFDGAFDDLDEFPDEIVEDGQVF